MVEPAPENAPQDDTTEGLRKQIDDQIAFHLGYRSSRATDAVMAVIAPAIERHRKAVEDAPAVAIWDGGCVECDESFKSGDRMTWRLRWSPQGPIHEECR